MNETQPGVPIETLVRQAFAVPEPDADFSARLRAELREQAARKPQKGINRLEFFFRRPVWALLCGALALLAALLWIGPGRVGAAVQQWLGYLPGLGFVQGADPALVLVQPLTARQGAVTVRVEDAVSDGSHTRIRLTAAGYQKTPAAPGPEGAQMALRLPDGSALALLGYQVALQPYSLVVDFAALPPGARAAALTLHSLPGLPADDAAGTRSTDGWRFDLAFQPLGTPGPGKGVSTAQPVTAVTGVTAVSEETEVSKATAVTGGTAAEPAPVTIAPLLQTPLAGAPQQGLTLQLNAAAWMDERSALQVRLLSADPAVLVEPGWVSRLRLTDDQGRPLALRTVFWEEAPGGMTVETAALKRGAAYHLALSGPVEVSRAVTSTPAPGEIITVDLGDDPQVGQTLVVDRTVHAAGWILYIQDAQVVQGNDGLLWLLFHFDADPRVTDVMFSPAAPAPEIQALLKSSGVALKAVPREPLRLSISRVFFTITGDWTLDWQTP
jgi:hypothetical protein